MRRNNEVKDLKCVKDLHEKQALFMTLLVNNGDVLERVPILKVKAVRQDLKEGISSHIFREHLLANGLAHSFFRGFLWVVPVNGKQDKEEILEDIIASYFRKKLEIMSDEIRDLNDDHLWLQVVLVLLRDALRYALHNKFKKHASVIVRGLQVFDKSQVIQVDASFYTVIGVSLARILPVDVNNIGLSPLLVYDVYCLNQRVTDKYERQRCITKSSRCPIDEYLRRLNYIVNKVFPLIINFSNKTLIFKLPYYYNIIREGGEDRQRRLKEWL